MHSFRRYIIAIFLFCNYGINAQIDKIPESSTQKNEIRLVIDQLFEGMRIGDSAIVRAVFHPSAKMRTSFVHPNTGQAVVRIENVNDFVIAVGTPHKEIWDERTTNYIYLIDDNLAQVWMDYSFYFNNHLEHCGVNSIQLIKIQGVWKITDIADTRRKTACLELPSE